MRGDAGLALLRLLPVLNPEWHLVLLGEQADREALLTAAIRLEVGHRLHLPGPVAEPAKVLGLFDVYVAAGDDDPVALAEAMAAGLPLAGTAGGEAEALLGDANRALLAAPGDEAGLANTITTLARDPHLRADVGAQNRSRARAQLDLAATLARHADLYARVLARERFP